MEINNNGAVRRRTNVIAAHLASHEDISATATHVLPMSCSNSLNSVIRRCDNRTLFARQGAISQGSFMRPASIKQGHFVQPGVPLESTSCKEKGSNASEAPMFSRPAPVERGAPSAQDSKSVVQGCRNTTYSGPDAPIFARPSYRNCGHPQTQYQNKRHCFASTGHNLSPRMDVAESGLSYVVTLEIPGVSIDNIKVEVNNQSLIITGNRSSGSWEEASGCSHKSTWTYHKKEISQGPYRIVWPLPNNADKENVTAAIQDGVLRVTIPKLSGLRWLRKAHM